MNAAGIIASKVLAPGELAARLNGWRLLDQRIVFSNGCFDILHLGHIDYLSRAAALGDKLVIGLNSDASTRRLKGPGRPINDERSRSLVLASLFFVDAVCLFEEDTPYELIRLLCPDVLVKGADYTIEQIVGADIVLANGGEVKTVAYLEGYSTTAIEQRIRSGK
ncbi:MAG TPA: D-glycero-beta-D-manno-heptose 1-phosphate adenylyltransferase [Anseongella sp.]|nr:D-glycero-beta-D-manno-heptose 1-phosphate adenylyltransferase [Anseongella sp.]